MNDARSASAQGLGQQSDASVALDQLRARVAGREWYHTIELAPGLTTPGYFDHRPIASQVLPTRLDGLRCLDVATFDGFWASQMAARGADEVVAVDLLDPRKWDWPVGSPSEAIEAISSRMGEADGFAIVAQALQHRVSRVNCSVYDLDPAEIGTFDFVFVGSLMIHLRDPVRALEAIRGICGGTLLLMDNIDPITTFTHRWRPIASFDGKGRPWWWRFNLSGLLRVVNSAGFTIVEGPDRIRLKRGVGRPLPPLTWGTLRDSSLRTDLHEGLFGDAHAVIRARPREDL